MCGLYVCLSVFIGDNREPYNNGLNELRWTGVSPGNDVLGVDLDHPWKGQFSEDIS